MGNDDDHEPAPFATVARPVVGGSDAIDASPAWVALPATASDRQMAKTLDVLFIIVIAAALVWLVESRNLRLSAVGLAVTAAVFAVLLPLLEVSVRGSMGKRIYEMHVLLPSGAPAPLGRRIARVILRSGPLYVAMVAFLGILIWHDKPWIGPFGSLVGIALLAQLACGITAFVGVCVLGLDRPLHDRWSGTVVGTREPIPRLKLRAFEVLPPAPKTGTGT